MSIFHPRLRGNIGGRFGEFVSVAVPMPIAGGFSNRRRRHHCERRRLARRRSRVHSAIETEKRVPACKMPHRPSSGRPAVFAAVAPSPIRAYAGSAAWEPSPIQNLIYINADCVTPSGHRWRFRTFCVPLHKSATMDFLPGNLQSGAIQCRARFWHLSH